MSSTGAGYDLSPTTFSPEGKLFQVEYAAKAVESSGTAIGITCKDGVVLGVEKVLKDKLLKAGTNKRIHTLANHAGLAMTGLVADGRQIVNRAREEIQSFEDNYGYDMPPDVLNDRLSMYIHYFTLSGALRPFGCQVLTATYDEAKGEAMLYMIEPSGVSYRYFGAAAGKGRQAAKTEIEKLNLKELSCKDALKEIAKIIHTLHDESKDKPFELEMSWICEESKWKHTTVPKDMITEAEEWAKKAIEDAEMEDDSDGDN
mmetsp:Transcript_3991/g.5257  ORF Transcript_3991/g.5257 Transcript_3991/m.5257 type:complete len:259 (-) Transcript_3991:99-875(-)